MSRTATSQRRAKERRTDYENGVLLPQEDKWCRMCDNVKTHEYFYIRYDYDGLLSQYCRKCHMKDNLAYKKRMRQHAKNT